jgi:hypothetical protein
LHEASAEYIQLLGLELATSCFDPTRKVKADLEGKPMKKAADDIIGRERRECVS